MISRIKIVVSIAYHSESINLNISVYSTFNLVILYSCTLITFNRRYRILEKTNAFWSVGPLKSDNQFVIFTT